MAVNSVSVDVNPDNLILLMKEVDRFKAAHQITDYFLERSTINIKWDNGWLVELGNYSFTHSLTWYNSTYNKELKFSINLDIDERDDGQDEGERIYYKIKKDEDEKIYTSKTVNKAFSNAWKWLNRR